MCRVTRLVGYVVNIMVKLVRYVINKVTRLVG